MTSPSDALRFTDDDLAKLKEEISWTKGQITILGTREMAHVFPEKLEALINRLEAAEKLIGHQDDAEWLVLYKEWEKVSGR